MQSKSSKPNTEAIKVKEALKDAQEDIKRFKRRLGRR